MSTPTPAPLTSTAHAHVHPHPHDHHHAHAAHGHHHHTSALPNRTAAAPPVLHGRDYAPARASLMLMGAAPRLGLAGLALIALWSLTFWALA